MQEANKTQSVYCSLVTLRTSHPTPSRISASLPVKWDDDRHLRGPGGGGGGVCHLLLHVKLVQPRPACAHTIDTRDYLFFFPEAEDLRLCFMGMVIKDRSLFQLQAVAVGCTGLSACFLVYAPCCLMLEAAPTELKACNGLKQNV